MKAALAGALLALVCAIAAPVLAHTGALAALELRVSGDRVIVGWSADDFASQGGLAAPTLQGCSPEAPPVWRCPVDLAGVSVIADFAGKDGQVVVTVSRESGTARGVLDPRSPAWEIPGADAADGTLLSYFTQGLHHIAGGIDHLVFVLGLLLLAPSARALLLVVTSFTVGHSVTLGISTITGFAPASAPTEALIAGSILLLARELVVSRREGRPGAHPAGLAVVFGLAHGFGFSGALAEVGVPPDEVGAALLGFNLGVEAGQLLFVAVLAALGALLGRVSAPGLAACRAALPWLIGAVSGLWFVERVTALG